jgi:hypothetical protein
MMVVVMMMMKVMMKFVCLCLCVCVCVCVCAHVRLEEGYTLLLQTWHAYTLKPGRDFEKVATQKVSWVEF